MSQLNTEVKQAIKVPTQNNKLIYFYSEHCGPCKLQSAVVKELSDEGFGILKVNMSEEGADEWMKKYDLMSTPTIVVEDKEGNLLQKIVGLVSKENLIEYAQ